MEPQQKIILRKWAIERAECALRFVGEEPAAENAIEYAEKIHEWVTSEKKTAG